MSLVMAFIGSKGAVMVGDMREITFQGDDASVERLEEELYNGRICTDIDLLTRARALGVKISIRDDKSKVSKRDNILMGEVSSFEKGIIRRRRLYASPGKYVIAELENDEMIITKKGEGSAFIVFGNNFVKKIANQTIKDHWKNGTLQDAVRIMILAMQNASKASASVSRTFTIEQTAKGVDLFRLIEKGI